MSTLRKGRITEAAVLNAFVRSNRVTLLPFGEGHSYDLAVDLEPGLLRVQCKTARPCPGGMIFNCRATDHGHGNASYEGLADVFGIHFAPSNAVYLVPVEGCPHSGKAILRIEATRNNQSLGIRLAADYEFGRWTDDALRRLAATDAALPARIAS